MSDIIMREADEWDLGFIFLFDEIEKEAEDK
jgi:hypothetical protein